MNILFRTSGGRAYKKELGLGHVYRCINIASHLSHHKIHFLIEDYGGVVKVLKSYGFNDSFLLKKNIDLNSDIEESQHYINEKKIDLVIIDKFCINLKYLREIKKSSKLVVISDLRKIDYPADLVVNGFIGFENSIFINKYGTKCLLGPLYQILNKKYMTKQILNKKKYTLLATFGGFDENNIVEILLETISEYLQQIKTKIILGPASKKSIKIKTLEKKYGNHLKIIDKTRDMHKEISNTQFGICAGGITTYEFAVMMVPFAIICQYPHQLITAKEWERKGIAINLGKINKNLKKRLRKFLNDILENKMNLNTTHNIIDGLGAQRVSREISKLL